MSEHKILNQQRQFKTVDPRIILVNNYDLEDETLTLRIAISQNSMFIFSYLWDNFSQLYNDKHLIVLARFIALQAREDYATIFLQSATTQKIFLNSAYSVRKDFVDVFANANLGETVDQHLSGDVYTKLSEELDSELLLKMYNLIKDNEVDHLRELIYGYGIQGIGHLVFDFFPEDEEVLTLSDDSKVTLSVLNPILLAIKYKSFSCLKYLVQEFGLAHSMKTLDFVIRQSED